MVDIQSLDRETWGKPSGTGQRTQVPIVGNCVSILGPISQVTGGNKVGPSECGQDINNTSYNLPQK